MDLYFSEIKSQKQIDQLVYSLQGLIPEEIFKVVA